MFIDGKGISIGLNGNSGYNVQSQMKNLKEISPYPGDRLNDSPTYKYQKELNKTYQS